MNYFLLSLATKLKSASFLGLFSLSLIIILYPVRAIAQMITNISIDPHNNSGYEAIPIDSNPTQINLNLPRGNSNNTARVISVKGSPTRPRVQFIDGNLVTSDQTLPSIPPIGQPYSPPSNVTSNSWMISDTPPNPPTNISSQNTLRNAEVTPPFSPSMENRATSPIATTSNSNRVFKVLVRVNSSSQESQIRQLHPDAFRTNHQGLSFLQVGVFSNQATAQQLSESLKNSGFNPLVVQ